MDNIDSNAVVKKHDVFVKFNLQRIVMKFDPKIKLDTNKMTGNNFR